MVPEPVTPSNKEIGRRSLSVFDLETTLVKFLDKLLSPYALDNPNLNEIQPDIVPYETTGRAQILTQKVNPRITRGRIPRTVTGELNADKLPNIPAVIVQAVSARVEQQMTCVTVRVLVATYDENPDSLGYLDVLNMIEAITLAFTTFGQAGIDRAYPIVMPLEWKMEPDIFPHFVGEITSEWTVPSGRPLPDFGIATPVVVSYPAPERPLPPADMS